MKKLLVILAAIMLACFSVSAFAVAYDDVEVKACIDFEGITDADLGGESQIIGDFDPHSTWQLTEGTASIVEGITGNGLEFTPLYDNDNGFTSCVMRAKMPVVAAEKDAWANSWGMRMYICNNTDYDVYVTPMATFYDATGVKSVLGVGYGAYTVDVDNEYEDVELEMYVDECDSTIHIPYGFEGYIVLPFAVMDTDADDYDCGWQMLPNWSDTGATPDMVNFADIAEFAMDIRVGSFMAGDMGGVVIDNIEFIGNAGETVDYPEEGGDDETGDTDNTTNAPTEAPDVTEAPTQTPADNTDGFPVWIIIVAAVVVVAIVVAVIVVSSKKKK